MSPTKIYLFTLLFTLIGSSLLCTEHDNLLEEYIKDWESRNSAKFSAKKLRQSFENGTIISSLCLPANLKELYTKRIYYKQAIVEDKERLERNRNEQWSSFKKMSWGSGTLLTGLGLTSIGLFALLITIGNEKLLGSLGSLIIIILGTCNIKDGLKKLWKNRSKTQIIKRRLKHLKNNEALDNFLDKVPNLVKEQVGGIHQA